MSLGDKWISTERVSPHALLIADYRARGVAWQIVVTALLIQLILVIPLTLSYTVLDEYIPSSITLQ